MGRVGAVGSGETDGLGDVELVLFCHCLIYCDNAYTQPFVVVGWGSGEGGGSEGRVGETDRLDDVELVLFCQ